MNGEVGAVAYLQILEVLGALVHTVLPQGHVEVVGETGLGDLQPPAQGVEVVEQGQAEGAGGRRRRLGDLGDGGLDDFYRLRLDGFRLGGRHHGDVGRS